MRSLDVGIARDRSTSDRIVLKCSVTLLVIAERGFVLSVDILGFLTARYPRSQVSGKCSHMFCNHLPEFLITNSVVSRRLV